MKRLDVIFGMLLLTIAVCQPVFSQNNLQKIDRVVIDAGHGGHDPGALSKNCREKDIVLSIALKAGEYIEKNIPDVKVIYTRKSDEFIELHNRARIANENHADLFISIHCNSSPKSTPFGAETYVMGLHKSEDNLEVAKLENESILLESDYSANYEGFDPSSDEAYIVFNLYQNIFLDQSLSMAVKVQEQFRERVGRHDRGVKQAGFLVLYRTTMPGVLIETGFLSNPTEERFLRSEEGQVYIASAIYRAFKDYKKEYESRMPDQYATFDAAPQTDKPKQSSTVQTVNITTPTDTYSKTTIRFRVQFYSSSGKIPLTSSTFSGIKDVREYYHGGLYKYTTGNEPKVETADQLCRSIRAKGFKDAFVVAFQDEQRIDLEKAKEMVK